MRTNSALITTLHEVVLVEWVLLSSAAVHRQQRRYDDDGKTDAPEHIARRVGSEPGDDEEHGAESELVATPGCDLARGARCARVTCMHHRDVRAEHRVRERHEALVVLDAIADDQRDQEEQQHLHEHEHALEPVVDCEAVGEQRRDEPDPPDGRKGRDCDDDHLQLGVVGDGVAEGHDRRDEDEVVEQLEPTDALRAVASLDR